MGDRPLAMLLFAAVTTGDFCLAEVAGHARTAGVLPQLGLAVLDSPGGSRSKALAAGGVSGGSRAEATGTTVQ